MGEAQTPPGCAGSTAGRTSDQPLAAPPPEAEVLRRERRRDVARGSLGPGAPEAPSERVPLEGDLGGVRFAPVPEAFDRDARVDAAEPFDADVDRRAADPDDLRVDEPFAVDVVLLRAADPFAVELVLLRAADPFAVEFVPLRVDDPFAAEPELLRADPVELDVRLADERFEGDAVLAAARVRDDVERDDAFAAVAGFEEFVVLAVRAAPAARPLLAARIRLVELAAAVAFRRDPLDDDPARVAPVFELVRDAERAAPDRDRPDEREVRREPPARRRVAPEEAPVAPAAAPAAAPDAAPAPFASAICARTSSAMIR